MQTLNQGLYDAVSFLAGSETVIFEEQNAPRPSSPYWTIKVQTIRSVGMESILPNLTSEGKTQITGLREAVIRLQRVGINSHIIAAEFVDNLSKNSTNEKWKEYGVFVYDTGDIQNVPYALDNNQWEQRAVLDVFIRFGVLVLDDIEYISTVAINASYGDTEEELEILI